MAIIEESVYDFFAMTDTDSSPFVPETVTDTLVFIETIHVNRLKGYVHNYLNLGQTINLTLTIINKTVNHMLAMRSLASKGPTLQRLTQSLFLYDKVYRNKVGSINQLYVPKQTITSVNAKLISQKFNPKQIITLAMIRHRTLSQTLIMTSIDIGVKLDYRFIGTPQVVPDVVLSEHSSHVIGLSSNGYVITLRDPEYGNIEKLEISRVNRKTRGGDLIVYRDPQWPIADTFDVKFLGLSQNDVYTLLNFMNVTLGMQIQMVDYEGTSWTGIIITPTAEVAQPGRQLWSAQFQFQRTN